MNRPARSASRCRRRPRPALTTPVRGSPPARLASTSSSLWRRPASSMHRRCRPYSHRQPARLPCAHQGPSFTGPPGREPRFRPARHGSAVRGGPGNETMPVKRQYWSNGDAGQMSVLVKRRYWSNGDAGQRRCWSKGGTVKGRYLPKGDAGQKAVMVKRRCWSKGDAGQKAMLVKRRCWPKGDAGQRRYWSKLCTVKRRCLSKGDSGQKAMLVKGGNGRKTNADQARMARAQA